MPILLIFAVRSPCIFETLTVQYYERSYPPSRHPKFIYPEKPTKGARMVGLRIVTYGVQGIEDTNDELSGYLSIE